MKHKSYHLAFAIGVLATIDLSMAQWIQQASGTNTQLTDVAMLDTSTAIAVGRDGSILRTEDAGATWANVAAPLSFFGAWNAVSFVLDTSYGIVVGDEGLTMLTSNRGKDWTARVIPSNQKCLAVLYRWPGNIYVGADSGWIYHSSDSGETWQPERISEWPIRALFEWRGTVTDSPPIYALTPNSIFLKMEFPAMPWSEKLLRHLQGLGSEAYGGEFCLGGGAGFIVGVQGDKREAPAILRKPMSDTTWYPVSYDIREDGRFMDVSAPTAETIYVCGSHGMIYKSTDGGDTWSPATVPTKQNLKAIYFYDEKHGFAVGDSGVILHTATGGTTSIEERETRPPLVFELEQNYPNPFNASTTISFSLPSSGFVVLKVYDPLGREVSTLISQPMAEGKHSVHWSPHNAPSGVYGYSLQAGAFRENRKLVLLK